MRQPSTRAAAQFLGLAPFKEILQVEVDAASDLTVDYAAGGGAAGHSFLYHAPHGDVLPPGRRYMKFLEGCDLRGLQSESGHRPEELILGATDTIHKPIGCP